MNWGEAGRGPPAPASRGSSKRVNRNQGGGAQQLGNIVLLTRWRGRRSFQKPSFALSANYRRAAPGRDSLYRFQFSELYSGQTRSAADAAAFFSFPFSPRKRFGGSRGRTYFLTAYEMVAAQRRFFNFSFSPGLGLVSGRNRLLSGLLAIIEKVSARRPARIILTFSRRSACLFFFPRTN